MSRGDLDKLSINDLVDRFIRISLAQEKALLYDELG